VTTKILRHIIRVADFGQRSGRKRLIDFFTREGRLSGELAFRQTVRHSTGLSVYWSGPEIHKPDASILQLGWRN